MKLLYLLPGLGYDGAARQALLLGRGLTEHCDLRVCALYQEGPWTRDVRAAGVRVTTLGWTWFMDPAPLWRLHRLLRGFEPDVVHVWRLSALRALAAAGPKYLRRCVASRVMPAAKPALSAVDRWLLRSVKTVVAEDDAQARSLNHLGLTNVSVIPPGVELIASAEDAKPIPRRIVCLGNLEYAKGFRDAMRAADYLAYPFRDMQFHLVGDGPSRSSLLRFQAGVFHQDHMHLLGARPDADSWLASAEVCWVPSLTGTGRQVALEAMAAGKPVVASDLPCFRALIRHGESGLLVPPGHATMLAHQTRRLFLDGGLRQRLGEAARLQVSRFFSVAQFVARFRELYGLPAYPALGSESLDLLGYPGSRMSKESSQGDAGQLSIAKHEAVAPQCLEAPFLERNPTSGRQS